MYDIDKAWARISQRPSMQGAQRSNYGIQVIGLRQALTGTTPVTNVPVKFPSGGFILAIEAGAHVTGQAATQTNRPGLDMFAVMLSYQANGGRNVIGPSTRAIGSSVFNQFFPFPAMEMEVPLNGSLLYDFEGLTSSNIEVFIEHHCLIPVNAS